jgi:hypothetical protein
MAELLGPLGNVVDMGDDVGAANVVKLCGNFLIAVSVVYNGIAYIMYCIYMYICIHVFLYCCVLECGQAVRKLSNRCKCMRFACYMCYIVYYIL